MNPSRVGNSAQNTRATLSEPSEQQQHRSQSTLSRTQPLTLVDLSQHRTTMRASKNPVMKHFANALDEVHSRFAQCEVTPDEHKQRCYELMEAAEKSSESTRQDALNSNDYKAVCDNLSLQLDSDRGVAAQHLRKADNLAGANSARGNFFIIFRKYEGN